MDIIVVLLAVAICVGFFFDFSNGFHDASNMVATLVASRALTPTQAILLVGVCTYAGPLIGGTAVADTIGGIVDMAGLPARQALGLILCGIGSATLWNLVTWRWSLPSSSSHALVGGLVGVVWLAISPARINWGFDAFLHGHWLGVAKVLGTLFISPFLGFAVGFVLQRLSRFALRAAHPSIERTLQRAQWITAGALAYSHGTNDAQKSMGIITLCLMICGTIKTFEVPDWVILGSATAMTLGTMLGGWRIARTVGYGIYRLRALHGLNAQLSSAAIIFSASSIGGPVSTTHVVSSTIMGVGAADRPRAVHWSTAHKIVAGWLMTMPAAALISVGLYSLLRLAGAMP